MSGSLYGTAAAMVLVAGIGVFAVAGGSNAKPTMATITTIDRTCDFVETTKHGDGHKKVADVTDGCNSTDEWEKARGEIRDHKRKKISGQATIHFSYTAPQDGSYHTGALKFDGGDDEFYELQAGSEMKILVSDKDPNKVRKA